MEICTARKAQASPQSPPQSPLHDQAFTLCYCALCQLCVVKVCAASAPHPPAPSQCRTGKAADDIRGNGDAWHAGAQEINNATKVGAVVPVVVCEKYACMYVCMCVCERVCMCVGACVSLRLCICLCLCLSVCPCVCPCVCLSVGLSLPLPPSSLLPPSLPPLSLSVCLIPPAPRLLALHGCEDGVRCGLDWDVQERIHPWVVQDLCHRLCQRCGDRHATRQ